MRLASLLSLALLTCGINSGLAAQNLYSQSMTDSAGQMVINLKLRGASTNATINVIVTRISPALQGVTATASPSFTTDASGYGSTQVVMQAINDCAPNLFRIELKRGATTVATKEYLLECRNGVIGSAWPEFSMILGAFCNPVESAAYHLQVGRTVDLDGDGVYGDIIQEFNSNNLDWLDFPSEFSTDVNGVGTNGCVGGVAPGVFQPGSARRHAAFIADNRTVVSISPCRFTTRMNFLQDLSFASSFNGVPTMFITSSSTDDVMICQDGDNSGHISDSEISTFFDPETLQGSTSWSPDGVAVDPSTAGRVYWVSDGSSGNQHGLYGMTDTDGSNSISATEWSAVWTGNTPTVLVAGVAVTPNQFECVHVDSSGAVFVNHTTLGTVFRWVDGNGDNVAQTGEVNDWLNYDWCGTLGGTSTINPLFSATQVYPPPAPPGAPAPCTATNYFPMNLLESVSGPNREVYFFAGTNSSGLAAGNVYRGEDLNDDGDLNDVNEVALFFNPATASVPASIPVNEIPGFTVGLGVATVDENGDGSITDDEIYAYIATTFGPGAPCGYTFADATNWRFHDGDGDGSANQAGESERISIHPTGAFVRNLTVMPPAHAGGFRHTFYSRSALMTVQAASCVTMQGNYLEIDSLRDKIEEGTQGTPFGGNRRFTVVSRGNSSGPPGLPTSGLLLSATSGGFPFSGCTFGLGLPFFLVGTAIPDATGQSAYPLRIPGNTRGTVFLTPFSLDFTSGTLALGEVGEMRIQ